MSANYKLTYFNLRGLAEVPRLLFRAAGVSFTDDRIAFEKKADGSFARGEWENDEYKKKFPFRQVPVLEVDGVQIAQSNAINRFLAKRFGFLGANDIEAALIDAVGEQLLDVRKAFFTASEKDGGQAGENVGKFWTTTFVDNLALLEANVKGNGHFVGSKLSLADVQLYYLLWVLSTENGPAVSAALEKNAKLKAISDAVSNQEGIKKWVAERPATIF